MKPRGGNRELATASVEELLRGCFTAPISEETESLVRRAGALARKEVKRRPEMVEAFSALRDALMPVHKWTIGKGIIAEAIGMDSRTIQRLLCRPEQGEAAGGGAQLSSKRKSSDQDYLTGAEPGSDSVTAKCRNQAAERAGRKLTFKPKPHAASASTAKNFQEAELRFSSNSQHTRDEAIRHIRREMVALGLTVSDLENTKTY